MQSSLNIANSNYLREFIAYNFIIALQDCYLDYLVYRTMYLDCLLKCQHDFFVYKTLYYLDCLVGCQQDCFGSNELNTERPLQKCVLMFAT